MRAFICIWAGLDGTTIRVCDAILYAGTEEEVAIIFTRFRTSKYPGVYATEQYRYRELVYAENASKMPVSG